MVAGYVPSNNATLEMSLEDEPIIPQNTKFMLSLKIEEDESVIDFPNISSRIKSWCFSAGDALLDAIDPDPSSPFPEEDEEFDQDDFGDEDEDEEYEDEIPLKPPVCVFRFDMCRAVIRELNILASMNYNEARLVVIHFDFHGNQICHHEFIGHTKSQDVYGSSTRDGLGVEYELTMFCNAFDLNSLKDMADVKQ